MTVGDDDYERAFRTHEAAIELVVSRHRAVCSCGFKSASGATHDAAHLLAEHLRSAGALPNVLTRLHENIALEAAAGIGRTANLVDAYRTDVSAERRDRARVDLLSVPFEDELQGRAGVLLAWYEEHVDEMTELLPGQQPFVQALCDFAYPDAAYARLASQVTDDLPDLLADPLEEVGWSMAEPGDRLELLFALAASELTRRAWERRPDVGLSEAEETRLRFVVADCIAGCFQGEAINRFELDLSLDIAQQLVGDEIAGLRGNSPLVPLAAHVWEQLGAITVDDLDLFALAYGALQHCHQWPAHPAWESAVVAFLDGKELPPGRWGLEAHVEDVLVVDPVRLPAEGLTWCLEHGLLDASR